MHIRAFHVEHFGLLRDVSVIDLPPGLSIFLGHNEAGKSTCLDFFRVMLTGYADKRTNEGRDRDYSAGSGGSLLLDSAQGLIRLTRRPGTGGGALSLHDEAGTTLDLALLDRLMGGVSREVFRNVYGFSLNELQTLNSLNDRDVRNALYGASFGMGLRSPGAALKRLEADMEALFKPGGSKQPLSSGLREWEDVRRQVREAESEVVRYDELAASLQDVEDGLCSLRGERTAQHHEVRELERRLGVWRQWEEWRLAGVRLERLEPVAASFPLDGISRLDRGLERHGEADRQGRLLRERMDGLRAEYEALALDLEVLNAGDALRALAERKASCRNALAELPRFEADARRAEADLAAQLATLGPGWSPDRIRTVDRSLFVREEIERQAADMHVAETAYATAMSALDRSARASDEGRHAALLARTTLENLPEPVADLAEASRDRLRTSLARTEDAQQRLPERIKAHDTAKLDFTRALAQAQVRPGEGAVPALEQLAAAQDEALALSNSVLVSMRESEQAHSLTEQAKEAEKQARLRMNRLQLEREQRGGPSRESIESRRSALRRLRNLISELAVARNRESEVRAGLEAHLAALPKPLSSPMWTWGGLFVAWCGLVVLLLRWQWGMDALNVADLALPLSSSFGFLLLGLGSAVAVSARPPELRRKAVLGCGALLVGCGGGAIAARRLFAIPEVIMPSGVRVPLELWSGYLVLLAGIACLAWAMGRKKPDESPQRLVADQWRLRCDDAHARVLTLEADVAALCSELVLPDAALASLDELEMRLDREREACAASERMDQEMAAHSRDIAELHSRAVELETDFAARNTKVQASQRRWHERMMALGVHSVPAPDGAQAFFLRVDQARRAWDAAQAINSELAAMEACGLELMRLGREHLPASFQPASWLSLYEVMDAVRRALEACREADRAAEERARAAEALRGAEAALERAEAERAESLHALRDTEVHMAEARQAWRASLHKLGLDLELSPATTREALDCMGRCLDGESECLRLNGERERQERERDAFILPAQDLLARLHRTPQVSPDGQPDWLASLDAALVDVEQQRTQAEARRQLERELAGLETELRAADEAVRDAAMQIEELLHLAEVADPETFRLKDAIRIERDALIRRREDLEDQLRLTADPLPLADFLADFASLDREQLESRLAELTSLLDASGHEETRLADEAGTLRAKLEQLRSSDLLTELRVQEAALRESLHGLGQEWARHALARHLLLEARRVFEKERQPEVIRAASSLLGVITDGQWVGVNAALEDGHLRVVPAFGEAVAPEQLSRGTQEQLYLSLRLAHIRQHGGLADPLPVIMDDILVNFDPARAERTARALVSLTEADERGPGHQILFFTCHPQLASMLQGVAPNSALLHVERGRVWRD